MVSSIVSGTPSATPDAEPMLFVMSLRTTPSSVRMLGPFVPSPGYGPSVSSGICSQVETVAAPAAVVAVVPPVVLVVARVLDDDALLPPSLPHAVSTTAAPSPPNQVSSSRRLGVGVCRSVMEASVPAPGQKQVAGE